MRQQVPLAASQGQACLLLLELPLIEWWFQDAVFGYKPSTLETQFPASPVVSPDFGPLRAFISAQIVK
jgi:hypothetical protein